MRGFIHCYWSITLNQILFILLSWLFISCDTIPKDPEHSLKEAKSNKLRVGVMEAAPWVSTEGRLVKGIEADIIKGFASYINAEIEWVTGSEEELMTLLRQYELHLVIGGITKDTPWKKHVGLTNTYRKEKIYICNSLGDALPDNIDDKKIGVKKGSAIGAYIKKKNGIPEYVESLDNYKGLIAIRESELGKHSCTHTNKVIKTEHHVIAVPKGENNLLMTLETYLNEIGY